MLTMANIFSIFLADDQQGGLPWWFWLLLLLIIILVVWWLWRSQKKAAPPAESAPAVVESVQMPAEVEVPQRAVSIPAEPDDLTIIEGIGPKIASTLQAAGITSFAQLANADISQLDQILKAAGLRLANPGSWADQARLAAEGKWDELKTLQDNLKGGRAV